MVKIFLKPLCFYLLFSIGIIFCEYYFFDFWRGLFPKEYNLLAFMAIIASVPLILYRIILTEKQVETSQKTLNTDILFRSLSFLGDEKTATKMLAIDKLLDLEKIDNTLQKAIDKRLRQHIKTLSDNDKKDHEYMRFIMKILLEKQKESKKWQIRHFNFDAANLEGVDFEGAPLMEASLVMANLSRANLRWANLSRAKLGGADLTEANLEGADLEGADLEGANLQGANLEGANFWWVSLSWAKLEGADLSGARRLLQEQLNVTHGNDKTQIPKNLKRPNHWGKSQGDQKQDIGEYVENMSPN